MAYRCRPLGRNFSLLSRQYSPTLSKTPFIRTMASDTKTPKQFEWLVVIPDLPGAQEKRLAVRPTHFSNLKPLIESGKFKTGGALLNEVPQSDDTTKWDFHGSTLVCVAESKEEVMEVLKNDVYSKEVWDLENVQMWPFKCAFRNP